MKAAMDSARQIATHRALRSESNRTAMNIGAFFDIDGTLLGSPSLERRLQRYLRWRGELTAAHGLKWLAEFLRLAKRGWTPATDGNKAHLAGISASIVEAFTASLARQPIAFFPGALMRLEWHAAQGHRIFLVSGTLQPLAEAVARQLLLRVTPCATQLEIVGGRYTGRVVGDAVCGLAKARALERLAVEHRLDLGRSYAYGDSRGDRWMLGRVGQPAAVNPAMGLAQIARWRGWPVLLWREEKPTPRRRVEKLQRSRVEESNPAAPGLTAAAERGK